MSALSSHSVTHSVAAHSTRTMHICVRVLAHKYHFHPSSPLSPLLLSHQVHPSREVLLLTQFCPWTEHLLMLEKEEGVQGQLKYVVFPDKGGTWRVQAVPISNGSFKNRFGFYICIVHLLYM